MKKTDNDTFMKQQESLKKLINELVLESPNLYYLESIMVANLIFERVQSSSNYQDLKKLKSKDILNLISHKSNCC